MARLKWNFTQSMQKMQYINLQPYVNINAVCSPHVSFAFCAFTHHSSFPITFSCSLPVGPVAALPSEPLAKV